MPSSASARASRLPRSGPLARSAIVRGSRSPAISACTIATTDLAFMPSDATEVILIPASLNYGDHVLGCRRLAAGRCPLA